MHESLCTLYIHGCTEEESRLKLIATHLQDLIMIGVSYEAYMRSVLL